MIALTVPAVLDYRILVTRAVDTACKVISTEKGDHGERAADLANAMVSAIGEAFNNVVEHSYDGCNGDARIVIKHDQAMIRVEISDDGEPFDIDAVPVPDLDALPESGMGVFIIRSFVDELSYQPGPPNVLTMKKYL